MLELRSPWAGGRQPLWLGRLLQGGVLSLHPPAQGEGEQGTGPGWAHPGAAATLGPRRPLRPILRAADLCISLENGCSVVIWHLQPLEA